MAKTPISLEEIITLIERAHGRGSQTAVPTVQVQKSDSFETFTGGVLKGWPLILAIFGLAAFLFNMNSNVTAQDLRINQNSEAIKSIETKLDAKSASDTLSNNDIVRRLDSLQTAVDNLKAK